MNFDKIHNRLPGIGSKTRYNGRRQGSNFGAGLLFGSVVSGLILAFNRFFTLLIGIILARTLGAKGYGIYAYAFAIMSLLTLFAEFGMPNLVMREVAANKAKRQWGVLRGLLRRSWQWVLLAATLVLLFSLLIGWYWVVEYDNSLSLTLIIMLLMLPFAALTKTIAGALRGLHCVVMGQSVEMLLRPIFVTIGITTLFYLWPSFRHPEYAMLVQLIAVLIVLVVGISSLRHNMPIPARKAQPVYHNRQWLGSAAPFVLIGGAMIINSQTDILMLGWMRSTQEVGLYRVAAQGATLMTFGLLSASAVVSPHFSRLHAQGNLKQLMHIYSRTRFLNFMITLPIAMVIIVFGGKLTSFVFGEEFIDSYVPLAILTIGYLVNIFFGPVGSLLTMTGFEKNTARILWQTAVINVTLNIALIPSFGMIGGAIATAVSLGLYHFKLYRVASMNIFNAKNP